MYSNYGYKSNEELIIGYGFMLEDNPADFYHVSLGIRIDTEDGTQLVSMPLSRHYGVGSSACEHAA